MAAFEIFVDTGINGAAICFKNGEPVNHFKFKRDKGGSGIQLQPFFNFCKSFKNKSNTLCFVEDPAKVPRSIKTTSTQYIIVGQILSVCELIHGNPPIMLSANQWIAWVRRSLNTKEKDSKTRSREFARRTFPQYIQEHYPTKTIPDGIADCLCMGAFFTHQSGELFSKL